MTTRVPDRLALQMKSHGEHTYPDECCGMMLGLEEDGVFDVHAVVEIDNRQDGNRRRRFLISPGQYRFAEKSADERNLTLLGFYHSHPDHPARPSAFDADHALPWFTYVIVSVMQGKAAEITAWTLRDDRSRFEENAISEQ